jgi:hypothetical protein
LAQNFKARKYAGFEKWVVTPNLGKIISKSILKEVSPSALIVGIASTHLVT